MSPCDPGLNARSGQVGLATPAGVAHLALSLQGLARLEEQFRARSFSELGEAMRTAPRSALVPAALALAVRPEAARSMIEGCTDEQIRSAIFQAVLNPFAEKPKAGVAPWGEWLRRAARMGLSGKSFWELSVQDWLVILDNGPDDGLSRTALQRLFELAPDEMEGNESRD